VKRVWLSRDAATGSFHHVERRLHLIARRFLSLHDDDHVADDPGKGMRITRRQGWGAIQHDHVVRHRHGQCPDRRGDRGACRRRCTSGRCGALRQDREPVDRGRAQQRFLRLRGVERERPKPAVLRQAQCPREGGVEPVYIHDDDLM
jgi:hypothetical protein